MADPFDYAVATNWRETSVTRSSTTKERPDIQVVEHGGQGAWGNFSVLDGGPEASNPNFSMTAFAFAGVEAEIQPCRRAYAGPPEKFPAVHQPVILHLAKLGFGLAGVAD